jgi:uncharacterized protein YpmB
MTQPARSTGLAFLKASIIVMGILIVAAVALLVYQLVWRSTALVRSVPPDAANAAVLRLGLPQATQVRTMTLSDRTLALHLAVPGQGEWIYVVPLAGEGRILKIAIGAGDAKP